MGVCKARESVKTTEKGIQGKDEDPCDQGLDRARLWVSPFSQTEISSASPEFARNSLNLLLDFGRECAIFPQNRASSTSAQ